MFVKKIVLSAALSLFGLGQFSMLGSATALTIGTVLISSKKAIAQGAQVLLQSGADKFKNGDFQGAIADLNGSIEINSTSDMAYSLRAAAKHLIEDYQGAIVDYTNALKINPDEPGTWYLRGKAKLETSELSNQLVAPSSGFEDPIIIIRESAIKDFNIAIKLDPDKAEFHKSRAFAKFLIEDYEQALVDFRQALFLDKSDITLYRLMAVTHNIIGNKEVACKNFKIALDAGDKLSVDLYNP